MSKIIKPRGWKMDSLAARLFGVVFIGMFIVLQRQYPKSVSKSGGSFGMFPSNGLIYGRLFDADK